MELIGYANTLHIPKVDTAGHIAGKHTRATLTDAERIKIKQINGCPVNKKIPTKIARSSFRKMCIKYQEHAGINSNIQNGKATRVTREGFKSNNRYMCSNCAIGKLVRGNKPFDPPFNITFIDVVKTEPTRKKTAKKRATQKLKKKDVLLIRQLHNDGNTIASILKMFPIVGRATVSNVVNRITWKHV